MTLHLYLVNERAFASENLMRTPFLLSLLASAIVLSGCADKGVVEVGIVPKQSAYDDRMLDSLGSQRYTEQQMLYLRKVEQFEQQLEDLDEKRRALESSLGVSQLEAGRGHVSASQDEAVRISEFASASHASQVRIAQESANQAVQQSLIENERDRKLMQAEIEANRKLVELDQAYSSSLRNAKSDAERVRLTSEFEAEQMKAEAQRQKALIEADAARELSQAEQRIHSQISLQKQSDAQARVAASQEAAAAHSRESQLLEKQRITVALANADAERRVQGDIAESQQALENHRKEMTEALAPYKAEIAQLERRIKQLEGQIESSGAVYLSRIALEEGRLEKLKGEAERLAEVGRTLINTPLSTPAPAIVQGLTPAAEQEISRLEAELMATRGELNARKAARIAEVEQRLAADLSRLSQRVALELASKGASHEATDAEAVRTSKAQVINAELVASKTEITNEARTQLAELNVKTEIAKANVVAPVVTGRAVYSGSYGEKPQAFAVKPPAPATAIASAPLVKPSPKHTSQSVASAPSAESRRDHRVATQDEPSSLKGDSVLVVSAFEPDHQKPARQIVHDVVVSGGTVAGGAIKPLVITPAATTYSVVYRYSDKGSAEKFSAFLRAYGVTDFTYQHSAKLGEHVLFMGRYTSAEQAASRVAFLNKTTATNHAKVIEADL